MEAVVNINGSIKPSKGNFLPFVLILDTVILNWWRRERSICVL